MLNPKTQERELAYLIKIDNIEPIVGSDNCEAAVVGGWRIMVRKNTFKPGDVAIYFEIDSQVPATEEFTFLASKHYKVKTQRYTFGGKGLMISQGLLMHPSDFGWENIKDGVIDSNDEMHIIGTPSQFLTKKLGVIYAMPDDNKRKAASADKYKLMAQRKPKIFKTKWARWFMKRSWGRKFMFLLFGRKRDKKSSWPSWVVKTDEERIQNLVHMIPDFQKEIWIPTEKIDGTSTTFTMKRKKSMDAMYTKHRSKITSIRLLIHGTRPSICRKKRRVSGLGLRMCGWNGCRRLPRTEQKPKECLMT